MLSNLRTLDLTDEGGFLCGKILAELGADVIKIERPAGDPGRNIGPFYGERPHPERSLYWNAYNTSKRSITLNIECEQGVRYFKELVKTADFLIESFSPGYLTGLGIGYKELRKTNPRIIVTSISAFGGSGPYKDFGASDISIMGMSGLMGIIGYMDRPPLRLGLDQSYCVAGTHAAIGTLFALYDRNRTGQGQHLDVSVYECMVLSNYWEPVRWEFEERLVNRSGDRLSRGRGTTRQLWKCKDGYVTWTMMGGRVEIERLKTIIERMDREGMGGFMKTVDLDNLHLSRLSDEEIKPLEDLLEAFFMQHTKAELEEFSKENNLTLSPVNDLQEVMVDQQLISRGYWEDIEYPELCANIKSPGFLFKSSERDTRVKRRAPLIGEHNREIFEKELGLTREEVAELREKKII